MTLVNAVNANEEPTEIEEIEEELAPDLPEKYQGKSMEDIIHMHQNSEKELSRQGNELGQLRQLSDKLLEMGTRKEPEQTTELDWDYDTQNAVESTVNSKVQAVDSKIDQLEQKIAIDGFKRKHPTYEKDSSTQEFVDWVSASKYRTNLYNKNYKGLDLDAAEELMNGWEDFSSTLEEDNSEKEVKQKRKRQLKDASLEKGSSGGSSKKVFNRTELINMKIYEPHKYESMLQEIELAYREGRVK